MASDLIIDDETSTDILFPSEMGRGYEPRDFLAHPPSMFAPPSEMPLIEENEWDARIEEQEATKSSLEHLRLRGNAGKMVPSLNQGPIGYCWGHSVTHTIMLQRMMANAPYIPLSAFSLCSIIKKGRDEGGWCGLAAEFARTIGVAPQSKWAQGNRRYKELDTPAMRAEMGKFRITEDWVDLSRPVYYQNLTFKQVASCLLMNIPCAVDFNWWGHSVCALRLVRVEAGSYGLKIWNSWADSWGDRGMGILRGSKALPNGAVATRTVMVA